MEDDELLDMLPTRISEWMSELNDDLDRLKRDLEITVKHKTKLYKQLWMTLTTTTTRRCDVSRSGSFVQDGRELGRRIGAAATTTNRSGFPDKSSRLQEDQRQSTVADEDDEDEDRFESRVICRGSKKRGSIERVQGVYHGTRETIPHDVAEADTEKGVAYRDVVVREPIDEENSRSRPPSMFLLEASPPGFVSKENSSANSADSQSNISVRDSSLNSVRMGPQSERSTLQSERVSLPPERPVSQSEPLPLQSERITLPEGSLSQSERAERTEATEEVDKNIEPSSLYPEPSISAVRQNLPTIDAPSPAPHPPVQTPLPPRPPPHDEADNDDDAVSAASSSNVQEVREELRHDLQKVDNQITDLMTKLIHQGHTKEQLVLSGFDPGLYKKVMKRVKHEKRVERRSRKREKSARDSGVDGIVEAIDKRRRTSVLTSEDEESDKSSVNRSHVPNDARGGGGEAPETLNAGMETGVESFVLKDAETPNVKSGSRSDSMDPSTSEPDDDDKFNRFLSKTKAIRPAKPADATESNEAEKEEQEKEEDEEIEEEKEELEDGEIETERPMTPGRDDFDAQDRWEKLQRSRRSPPPPRETSRSRETPTEAGDAHDSLHQTLVNKARRRINKIHTSVIKGEPQFRIGEEDYRRYLCRSPRFAAHSSDIPSKSTSSSASSSPEDNGGVSMNPCSARPLPKLDTVKLQIQKKLEERKEKDRIEKLRRIQEKQEKDRKEKETRRTERERAEREKAENAGKRQHQQQLQDKKHGQEQQHQHAAESTSRMPPFSAFSPPDGVDDYTLKEMDVEEEEEEESLEERFDVATEDAFVSNASNEYHPFQHSVGSHAGKRHFNMDRLRKIYVGKLQNYTVPIIKRYFERFGKVENVLKPSPSMNFAFVTFAESDTVDKVMRHGQHFVEHDLVHLSQEVFIRRFCGKHNKQTLHLKLLSRTGEDDSSVAPTDVHGYFESIGMRPREILDFHQLSEEEFGTIVSFRDVDCVDKLVYMDEQKSVEINGVPFDVFPFFKV